MITVKQFTVFEQLYNYYNKELLDGKLNDCLINMSRKKKAYGFFGAGYWQNENGKYAHEITLTPEGLERESVEWHSTLVHEMVHLWQNDFGKPVRANYHNKEWANKMLEIGLIPSTTGKEGGKKTGQCVSHYVDNNGKFIKAFNKLKENKTIYKPNSDFLTTTKKQKESAKTKYECSCGVKVWGKPELNIKCLACNGIFKQANKDNKEPK